MTKSKKIKILFVHHFAGMGGATMSLFYIIERLDLDLFDVQVLFLDGKGEGIDYFRERGIDVITRNDIVNYPHAHNAYLSFISRKPFEPISRLFKINSSVSKLLPFFVRSQYDIVHLNTSLLLPVGKAAKLSGSKVVWHIREPLKKGVLGLRRLFIRKWIKKYADKIIAITEIEKINLGESDKTLVVHNYVDFKKFDPTIEYESLRKEFLIKENDFVVCNLGGAVHSKGGDVYIKAARSVLNSCSNVKFILTGDVGIPRNTTNRISASVKKILGLKYNLSSDIHRLVRENKLEKEVIITGVRTDIPEIVAVSDVLVWSATVPHFARPIIEAGAMSKPVVVADFPNAKVAMKNGISGLVFHPKDANDLAKKIIALYKDQKLGKKMGTEGRKIVQNKFNSEKNFKIIEDIYFDIARKVIQ
jgi:glycosyltransferase involved in cell wall biosynthesis